LKRRAAHAEGLAHDRTHDAILAEKNLERLANDPQHAPGRHGDALARMNKREGDLLPHLALLMIFNAWRTVMVAGPVALN
jgi:hypothetical protein